MAVNPTAIAVFNELVCNFDAGIYIMERIAYQICKVDEPDPSRIFPPFSIIAHII